MRILVSVNRVVDYNVEARVKSIRKEPEAPIMGVADDGLVADMFGAVTELTPNI